MQLGPRAKLPVGVIFDCDMGDRVDDALALASDIPVARFGVVEVRPIYHVFDTDWSQAGGGQWLGLILEPQASASVPGTPEWEAKAAPHGDFVAAAGDHIAGGGALQAPTTATTVRVRGDEVVLTDGPFAEGAEVATGFYLLRAADRDEAVKLASMIPGSAIQVRQLAGVSGL